MKIQHAWKGVALAAAFAACGPGLAQAPESESESAIEAVEDVDGLEVIIEQQQALRSDIEAGTVEGLSARQVNRIRDEQASVFELIGDRRRMDDLSINEKVELENALERINAHVKNRRSARGEQDVCWRERTTGSRRMTTRCGTEAERDQAREGARSYLGRPRVCRPPGCGA